MTNFNPRGIFENCQILTQQVTMGATEAMSYYAKRGYIPFIPTPDAQCDVDLLVYHPIKSTLSLNLFLIASGLFVSFLYCFQVPLTA